MRPHSSIVPKERARELRALLRNAGIRGLASFTLVQRFGPVEGPRVLAGLVAIGVIDAAGDDGHHRITEAGRLYATGRGSARFTRKAGEKALQAFLERCHVLLRAPGSLCVPSRVVLVGDMLDHAPQISGVDLALSLAFTRAAEQRMGAFDPARRKPLLLGTRAYGDVEAWQAAAINAACLYLRARSPILDVSRRIATLAADVPHRLVFEAHGVRPTLPPSRR